MTVPYTGEVYSITASDTNPNFTVQYYANLEVVNSTKNPGDHELDIIDTSGSKLPKNNKDLALKKLYLTLLNQSAEPKDKQYKVAKHLELQEVYSPKGYNYIEAPSLGYFNRLYRNKNYSLKEIWVLKEGVTDSKSLTESSWDIYPDRGDSFDKLENIHFTNRPEVANGEVSTDPDHTFVLINEGAVIRLVFDETNEFTKNVNADFFDYDISDGFLYSDYGFTTKIDVQPELKSNVYANTVKQGINHEDNYAGKGVGSKFAFGNANTGTGRENESIYNEQYLNYINRRNRIIDTTTDINPFGITFEIANPELGENHGLNYNKGIIGPKIFDKSVEEKGKTYIKDISTLEFSRSGDTYTLKSVPGTSAKNLDIFNHPTTNTKTHETIHTNNFWPMDDAETFGTLGHDLKFGATLPNSSTVANRYFAEKSKFPVSDDGLDHNSYFGMTFAVEFQYEKEYVGPLEYLFFGDDDMWVYLDGKLICDIGGVHSSVGEYVNIKDYLPQGDGQTHRLDFFYTERGASGSTCYMQFTLPSLSTAVPSQNTGDIEVEKKLEGEDIGQEFQFLVNLYKPVLDSNGNPVYKDGEIKYTPLLDDYSYIRYDSQGNKIKDDLVIFNEGTFELKAGESVKIRYLPLGTKFVITEIQTDGASTSIKYGDDIIQGAEISGIVSEEAFDDNINIIYINKYGYKLPKTGGLGNRIGFLGLSITAAALFGLIQQFKKTDWFNAKNIND